MKLLTFKVTPHSFFGTLPKGDTLFGHIAAYDYLEGGMHFENSLHRPNLVVSDMMPLGYVYRPSLPLRCFGNLEKKEIRKKRYIKLEHLQKGELEKIERIDLFQEIYTVKNSINRTTFSTDGAEFAPFSAKEYGISKELWFFVLVEENIEKRVIELLEKIAHFGFGKDTSIGKGKFFLKLLKENPIKKIDSPYKMTLSPVIFQKEEFKQCWYEPFTRFGKYGLHNAFNNAFKKPVLLADSGAVIKSNTKQQYIGRTIENGNTQKPSYQQGYAITIPFELKDDSCLASN